MKKRYRRFAGWGACALLVGALAVVSAGIDNDYGHPAPNTLDLLRHLGMTVARTDTGGSIAVVRTPTGLGLANSGLPPCPTCRAA